MTSLSTFRSAGYNARHMWQPARRQWARIWLVAEHDLLERSYYDERNRSAVTRFRIDLKHTADPFERAAPSRGASAVKRISLTTMLLVSIAACRSAAPVAVATATPPPATAAASTPSAIPVPDSIRWVRTSAEYVAALEQVYRLATARVEAEARTHTAGSWAVVLDADETVINNTLYQEERARAGLGYSEESWDAWVKRREATPLPGVGAFLSRVRALGGRIAVVTNRLQTQCPDTAAVFERYSLLYDAMLCRVNGTSSNKNPRFQAVAAGQTLAGATPLDVVAFIGDNIQDFPALGQAVRGTGPEGFAAFGVRFFVVPNPMYGSWQ